MSDQEKKQADKSQRDETPGASSGSLTGEGLGGGSSLTSLMHTGFGLDSPFTREIYLKRQVIVGARFQGGSDELVEDLKTGTRVTFLREPENAFDPKAIMALDQQGRKLGYIPRQENGLMHALMAAGKYFFGIIADPPKAEEYSGSKTPYAIWVDLYMREFARPGDLSEIPLQGYQGSYVVADFHFDPMEKGLAVTGIYALKFIRGEERGTYCRFLAEDDTERYYEEYSRHAETKEKEEGNRRRPEDCRRVMNEDGSRERKGRTHQGITDLDSQKQEDLIKGFARFAGHLPIVTFHILGRRLECLQEACDMAMGTTFSNRIIDTLQMAQNHIPEVRSGELSQLADHLGISIHCPDPREERCRTIWQLYCRMERSELANRKISHGIKGADLKRGTDDNLDILWSDLGLSERTRNILYKNKLDTVRELTVLSEKEAASLAYMDEKTMGELQQVLKTLNTTFRPPKRDPFLYGYPREIRRLPMDRPDFWEYLFFMELIRTRYQWLQPLRHRHMSPGMTSLLCPKIETLQELTDLITENYHRVYGYSREILSTVNDRGEDILGTEDQPGDLGKIYEMADRLMNLYKTIIHWMEDFGALETLPEYSKALATFTRLGGEICEFYDLLYESCQKKIRSVRDYLEGFIDKETVDTNLNLSMTLTGTAWDEVFHILEKESGLSIDGTQDGRAQDDEVQDDRV